MSEQHAQCHRCKAPMYPGADGSGILCKQCYTMAMERPEEGIHDLAWAQRALADIAERSHATGMHGVSGSLSLCLRIFNERIEHLQKENRELRARVQNLTAYD